MPSQIDPEHGTAHERKLPLDSRTAAELMTPQVASIDQGAPLSRAVFTLVDRKFSAAPVTDEPGGRVGAVSVTDMLISDRNALAYARHVPE